jgi:hypothetical protein
MLKSLKMFCNQTRTNKMSFFVDSGHDDAEFGGRGFKAPKIKIKAPKVKAPKMKAHATKKHIGKPTMSAHGKNQHSGGGHGHGHGHGGGGGHNHQEHQPHHIIEEHHHHHNNGGDDDGSGGTSGRRGSGFMKHVAGHVARAAQHLANKANVYRR